MENDNKFCPKQISNSKALGDILRNSVIILSLLIKLARPLWACILAKFDSLDDDMFDLNQVLILLSEEKLLSDSQDVTGNVLAIFYKVVTFGNMHSSI